MRPYICEDLGSTDELLLRSPIFMARARRLLGELSVDPSQLDDHDVLALLATLPPRPALATQVSLLFDGATLVWRSASADRIDRTAWSAVSGRPGYQTKEHQNLVDKGPLPEGCWHVKQSRYQKMQRTALEVLKNEFGGGKWPGGASSWGHHRVWLEPATGTNTLGRSGFSIHGGDTPGSAGCIDLTGNMPDFVRIFRAHGQDVELSVVYP